jgi:hypothetical protein
LLIFTSSFYSSSHLFVIIYYNLPNQDQMVHIDTTSLNGLRGLAAMHVAVGHFFVFSQQPTEVRE